MRRGICFFCILFLLPLSLFPGENKPLLTIIYSSSLNGNLDGCTCTSNPRAGLVKRGFFIKNLKNRENIVLLDAGNILDAVPDALLAEHIFAAYNDLGYDAIAAGEQEFSNGIDTLLEYRLTYPLLSHNLYICPTKDSCFIFSIMPRIIKKNTVSPGIFSLFDPGLLNLLEQENRKKIKVKDPLVVAGNMVALLKEEKADIIILLFHGYLETALKLAREVEGIDLIILGHEQKLIDMRKVGNTIVVSPGKEGNSVGILTITSKPGGGFFYSNIFKDFDYSVDPDDTSIRERIDSYNRDKTGVE